MSSPIETPGEAETLLHHLGKALYAIAGLHLVMGSILASRGGSVEFLADVVFSAVAGYLLPRSHSRALATCVFIWAVGCALITFAARFGAAPGGRNIILALLLVVLAWRCVQATFRYHKLTASRLVWRNVAIVATLHSVAAVVVIVGVIVLLAVAESFGSQWSEESAGLFLMAAIGSTALMIYALSRMWLPLLASAVMVNPAISADGDIQDGGPANDQA